MTPTIWQRPPPPRGCLTTALRGALLLACGVLASCLAVNATYKAPGPKGGEVTLSRYALGLNIEGLDASVVVPCNGAETPTPNTTPAEAMCPVFHVHESKVDSTTAAAETLPVLADAVHIMAAKAADNSTKAPPPRQ